MNGGSIYFLLARGGGLPPHLQEVELGEAGLLAGAAGGARSRASLRGERATTHDLGRMGPSGWSRYRPIDRVRTLCRHAGEATVSRAVGSGSEMEA
jgi:hypothetical protein